MKSKLTPTISQFLHYIVNNGSTTCSRLRSFRKPNCANLCLDLRRNNLVFKIRPMNFKEMCNKEFCKVP